MKNIYFVRYKNNLPSQLINGIVMYDATTMAKPFGKQPCDWMRLKQTNDYLTALSTLRKTPRTELVYIVQGGNNSQSTWLQEEVALEFARWLNPQFGIWFHDCIECATRKNNRSWKGFFLSLCGTIISKLSSHDENQETDTGIR